MKKQTGLALSIPLGLAAAQLLAMILTILLSAILTAMVLYKKIPEAGIGYFVMGILAVTAFISSIYASIKIKRRKILVCLSTGLLYCCALLCLAFLCFNGQVSTIWVSAITILSGSSIAALCVKIKEIRSPSFSRSHSHSHSQKHRVS